MKLTTLNLSFPVKMFKVSVEHFTPRNSTAIEWAVLAAAGTVESLPEFKDVSIERFFSDILKIADSNLLVKPCILGLMDLGALEQSDDIYDSVDLGKVRMGVLKMTPDGREMQQRGLLPGVTTQNDASFNYNIFYKTLLTGANSGLRMDSQGVEIVEDDVDLDDVDMPVQAIRQYLMKNAASYHWMNANTEIKNIEDESDDSENIRWQVVPKNIVVSGAGKLSIENGESDFMEDKVLKYLADDVHAVHINTDSVERLEIKDIDSEYSRIVLQNFIYDNVRAEVDSESVCVVNGAFVDKALSVSNVRPGRILVVAGASQLECKYEAKLKSLIINVPSQEGLGSIVFASAAKSLIIGSLRLYTGRTEASLVAALLPKKSTFDFSSYCTNLVQKHAGENEDVLFLLLGIGKKDIFVERLDALMDSAKKELSERGAFLSEVQEKGSLYFGRNVLSVEQEKTLLFKNWKPKNISFSDFKEQIGELLKLPYFKNRPWAMQHAISEMMDHVAPIESFENLKQFYEFAAVSPVREIFRDAIFRDPKISQKLDSDENIEFMMMFFDILPSQMSLTGIQSRLLDMQKAFFDLMSEVKRVGFSVGTSEAERKSLILKNKEILPALNVKVNAFKRAKAAFSEALRKRATVNKTDIENVEYFEKPEFEPYLQCLRSVRGVSASISPYLGVLSGSYDRVYIVDTCAIMENPELLDIFKTNNDALIVPKQVLDELDKNKMKKDEDASHKAQIAAKKIAEVRDLKKKGQNWFFIEDSDPSLLPKEYASGHVSGDDLIMSVALKYRLKDPIILTNDVNFGNKLYGEYIRQQSSKLFLEEHLKKGAKK